MPQQPDLDLQLAFAEEGQGLFDRLLQLRLEAVPNRTLLQWRPRLEKLSKDQRRDLARAAVVKLAASFGDRECEQLQRYGLSAKNIKQLKAGDLRCGLKVYSHLPDDFSRISLVPGYLRHPLVDRMRAQVEVMHGGMTLEQLAERAAKCLDRTGHYPASRVKPVIPSPQPLEIAPLDLQWLQPLSSAHSAVEQQLQDTETLVAPTRREPHETARDRRPGRRTPRHG